MEVHPPHGAIHSIKEFCVHLLTVIIGILIALSLDGLVESHHHRALLREARANVAAEMRDNRASLKKGLNAAPGAEAELKKTIEVMEAHRIDPKAAWSSFTWNFGLFPLTSIAWSSAGSTGAIGYMDYAEVQRYTRVYLLQEQFLTVQQRALDRWLDLQKWGERMDHGKGGAPVLDIGELPQVESAAATALIYTRTEESIATSLLEEYDKALAAPEAGRGLSAATK